MAPLLICANLVSSFKFWSNGQICDGMTYRNEFFRSIQTVNPERRQQIFDLGWVLSQEGAQVIITVSKQQYMLWISLHSYATLEALAEQQVGSEQPLVTPISSMMEQTETLV